MGQFLGQAKRLVASLESLVWIAKRPQGLRRPVAAHHPRVPTIQNGMGTVLVGIIQGNPPLCVRQARDKLAEGGQDCRQSSVSLQQQPWILYVLG
jgi:hypothetical protein